MGKIYIKDLKIDDYNFEEKEIEIYPLTLFSNGNNYLMNLIWYITDTHFFEFYRINDYEVLSISKIISGIIEHTNYSAEIDNDMLMECTDFVNDILQHNKNNILNKLFFENSYKSIDKLSIINNLSTSININSSFSDDSNIIDIIFIYNKKSFSSKAFFSRKIDIFIFVLQNIIKLILTNNIYNNIYIPFYNAYNIDLKDALNKNMYIRDFLFKLNEIKLRDEVSYNQIKNINDLIKIFFENYNSFNIFIENFSLNKELKEFIEKNVNNGKNILISLENDSMVNYLLTDNIFKDISFFY